MVAVSNHPFRPLRHRSVRLLWTAAVVSDIGTWVQLIVVGSLVASDTRSAVQTALVAIATFAPQGLASPIGGLLADRFDRRTVFGVALMVQATVTGVLAVVLGSGVRTPAVLAALILVASAAGAVGAPAYSAMLPDLVPADELMAMVSLGVYSWNAGRIIGPLLGSLLALTIGAPWTVAFNAATFIVLASAVWLVKQHFIPPGDDGSIVERFVGGWQALRHTKGCWYVVSTLMLYNITIVPFMGLMPIYARAVFDGGTSLAGAFSAAQGIGAIVGGVAVTMLARTRRRSTLLPGVLFSVTLLLLGFALAPSRLAALLIIVPLGGAAAATFVTVTAIVQRDAPPASRGRVMAMTQACQGSAYGVGLLLVGIIGDAASLRWAFGLGAVAMMAVMLVMARVRNDWRTVIDGREFDNLESPLAVAH
jgi:MFS family permease